MNLAIKDLMGYKVYNVSHLGHKKSLSHEEIERLIKNRVVMPVTMNYCILISDVVNRNGTIRFAGHPTISKGFRIMNKEKLE